MRCNSARAAISVLLCGAIVFPASASPAAAKAESHRVTILVESLDLGASEIAYRCPPESSEIVHAAMGQGVSKNVSRLKAGKRASVRIETQGPRPVLVEIEGSHRLRTVLLVIGAAVVVVTIAVAALIASDPP